MTRRKKISIVFFGNERLATGVTPGLSIVESLLSHGYEVLEIFTKHDSDGKKSPELDIKNTADKHNIPLKTSLNMKTIADELKSLNPDVGVLVAYGLIVPKEVIDIFPSGILNIHPSLLPKGRGPTPIEETILDGSLETGVSIMQLSEEMDKGPVLAQKKLKLEGKETKQELSDKLLKSGNELLIDCLERISSGEKLTSSSQTESRATYTSKIKKSDGIIDWTKPAEQIEREIRAYAGWPKTRTKLNDIDCIILSAMVLGDTGSPGNYKFNKESLIIFSGEGSLSVQLIQPAGKKAMQIDEFLRGYKSRL